MALAKTGNSPSASMTVVAWLRGNLAFRESSRPFCKQRRNIELFQNREHGVVRQGLRSLSGNFGFAYASYKVGLSLLKPRVYKWSCGTHHDIQRIGRSKSNLIRAVCCKDDVDLHDAPG